jgi:Xaa-Pro aminopeptidase
MRKPDEARLSAALEFSMRLNGAQGFAYPPVVASGCAALTLHYGVFVVVVFGVVGI